MKRFLLWIISVALGVALLLAAVMGVSYAFTTQGGCPDAAAQFGGQELETNGFCWQVPLLGGRLDKVFASPATLTVQKLGTLYTAHPAFTLPDWYSYGPLTITDSAGNVVFEGTAATYDDFLFPANGDYKAELTVWRLPENMLATQFEGGSTGELRQDVRLEKPAKPIGWYYYSFRFTLQASAEVELSAERMEQGGTVAALRVKTVCYSSKSGYSSSSSNSASVMARSLARVLSVRASSSSSSMPSGSLLPLQPLSTRRRSIASDAIRYPLLRMILFLSKKTKPPSLSIGAKAFMLHGTTLIILSLLERHLSRPVTGTRRSAPRGLLQSGCSAPVAEGFHRFPLASRLVCKADFFIAFHA